MENELIGSIKDLKNSVDSLTAIQTDIFNTDTSNDDIMSLKNKMQSLIDSNAELKTQIGYLNVAINQLANNINK